MFRVLVVGAGGMLARDLLAQTPAGTETVARTSRELDVTDGAAVQSVVADVAPHVVINCAAYTDVDGAESNQSRAFAVNGDAPGLIAAALKRMGDDRAAAPLLVHYSTDYVFDGTGRRPYGESDPTSPLGVYGASKLAGESAISAQGGRFLILRTQWLYGFHGKSFPRTMHDRARAGAATKVVTDQTGCPTYAVDLARATWDFVGLERQTASGAGLAPARSRILHVANAGTATWYDIAHRVFARADKLHLLSACTTADFPRPARRPAWSVLDTACAAQVLGGSLPRWEDALDRFLGELDATAVKEVTV